MIALDDLSTGDPGNLAGALSDERFRLVRGDVADVAAVRGCLEGADVVFHLAANADVRHGLEHPHRDLESNTVGTHRVLEAARAEGVPRFALASSGAVYGEPDVVPTPEDAPFPVQTSLYGASKLAAEALVAAYCAGFGMTGVAFRFVSVLGERYHHGHVADFCRSLARDPDHLDVLGDGTQRKSYLHVGDCVEGVVALTLAAAGGFGVFNLGTDESCDVRTSVRWICEDLGVDPRVAYGEGPRGWVGDSPLVLLDCTRARAAGWRPGVSIREAVTRTVEDLCRRGLAPRSVALRSP